MTLQQTTVVILFFFFQNLKTKSYDDCESWLQGFKIPDSFSSRTMECISTSILTQSCRTEIIQTLAALMWVHTHYPSKEAYNTVCAKLSKYPALKHSKVVKKNFS